MTTLVHFQLDKLHKNPETVVDIEAWYSDGKHNKRASDYKFGAVIHTLTTPGEHFDKHIHGAVVFVLRERRKP